MRQVTDFEIDPDKNIVIITRVTMTLDEFLRRAGEVYKFATDIGGDLRQVKEIGRDA